MAADAALRAVREFTALVEGPAVPEVRECLGPVSTSLQVFLCHSDSRVRLLAASALLMLSKRYPEDLLNQDLGRIRAAHFRASNALAGDAGAMAEDDAEEMIRLLAETLQELDAWRSKGAEGDAASTQRPVPPALSRGYNGCASMPALAPSRQRRYNLPKAERGNVVFRAGPTYEGKDLPQLGTPSLGAVVAVAGVMSVTFEGPHVIVGTRTKDLADDTEFQASVLQVLKEQALTDLIPVSPSGPLVPASGPDSAEEPELEPIADKQSDGLKEPAYLDDEEGDTPASPLPAVMPWMFTPGSPGVATTWSFFSQSNWLSSQRMQEFADDPSVTARLARARSREERSKAAQSSRIGRLFGRGVSGGGA